MSLGKFPGEEADVRPVEVSISRYESGPEIIDTDWHTGRRETGIGDETAVASGYSDAAFEGEGRYYLFHVVETEGGRSHGWGLTDDKGLAAVSSPVSKVTWDSGTLSNCCAWSSPGSNEEINDWDASHHKVYGGETLASGPILDGEHLSTNGEKGTSNESHVA